MLAFLAKWSLVKVSGAISGSVHDAPESLISPQYGVEPHTGAAFEVIFPLIFGVAGLVMVSAFMVLLWSKGSWSDVE
jgi:hypothetical protein